MKKIIAWAATAAVALGVGVAALPKAPQEIAPASAATIFSDDFSQYDIYGPSGATNPSSGIVNNQKTVKMNWGNLWFDGIGDGKYDESCNTAQAEITTDPADSSNKVLKLNTATTQQSFFHLTPRGSDGNLLVLQDYEVNFKFKLNPTSQMQAYVNTDSAPWFGILNRKTTEDASGNLVPKDGHYNGTNNVMTLMRTGLREGDPSGTNPYYFTEINRCIGESVSQVPKIRGENGGSAVDNTSAAIYNTWHNYKVVVTGNEMDMYLNGFQNAHKTFHILTSYINFCRG